MRRASKADPDEANKLEYCSLCDAMHQRDSRKGRRCRLRRELAAEKKARDKEASA